MIKIGLLEDDEVVAAMLEIAFDESAWSCDRYGTIADLKTALWDEPYDLLVLDWSVPDGTADMLIPWVRERYGWELPILIESVLGDEAQIVRALELGADDYVVKPLRLAEVNARIQALLRRKRAPSEQFIECGPYRVDLAERALTFNGESVDLTRVELDLAVHFFQHAGELLTRQALLATVWGISASLDTRTVDTHVSRLRKKLKMGTEHGVQISCLNRFGYRLETVEPSPVISRA